MNETLVLTFAELEFVLRAGTAALPVREQLRLKRLDDTVAAAGLASLLARGLGTVSGEQVVPNREITIVSTALSEATVAATVLSVGTGQQTFVHFLAADGIGVAIVPAGLGQYSIAPIDPAIALTSQVADVVEAILSDKTTAALVQVVRGQHGKTGIVVARDDTGAWFVSDTERSPDKGMPATPESALDRVREVVEGVVATVPGS